MIQGLRGYIWSERADLGSESTDISALRADLRSEVPDLKLGRAPKEMKSCRTLVFGLTEG